MSRQAIHTDSAVASPAYSQAIVSGDLVFVSGTVGKDMATGTWPAGIEAQGAHALRTSRRF